MTKGLIQQGESFLDSVYSGKFLEDNQTELVGLAGQDFCVVWQNVRFFLAKQVNEL